MDLIKGEATIAIVNYRTLDITRLCLRAIRKFTHYPHRVIVVDNDSGDESLDYLRSVPWITLIERHFDEKQTARWYHGSALNLAFERCETEYFVSLHTDAIALRTGWLSMLVRAAERDPRIATVGTGLQGYRSPLYAFFHRMTRFKRFRKRLMGHPDVAKYRYYNRTQCCLYRTQILRDEGVHFLMDDRYQGTVGFKLYVELEDRGYPMVKIPVREMDKWVAHLGQATQMTNRPDKIKKNQRRQFKGVYAHVLNAPGVQAVLADESLDR